MRVNRERALVRATPRRMENRGLAPAIAGGNQEGLSQFINLGPHAERWEEREVLRK